MPSRNWVCVDIQSTNASTAPRQASPTKWARSQRVWIRILDQDTSHVVEQWTVGFIDARYTGPRSRAHRTLEAARHSYQEMIDTVMAGAMPDDLWAIFCRPNGARNLKEHLAQMKSDRGDYNGVEAVSIVS
jgi:hypothetical protein